MIILLIIFYISCNFKEERNKFYIAIIGPGKNKPEGKMSINAVKMYLDEMNSKLKDKQFEPILYNDENNENLAQKEAKRIIEEDKAIAVIGHWFTECSVAAGSVYSKNEIAAITPGSTDVQITKDNNYYFRIVYNNQIESRFIIQYAYEVLRKDTVTIVYEDRLYGRNIAKEACKIATALGMNIKHKLSFSFHGKGSVRDQMQSIVETILSGENDRSVNSNNFIFLALKANQGKQLVQLIRDNGLQNVIFAPLGFATDSFRKTFIGKSMDKWHNGFYTNNLYVTTPLIFDTSNDMAQNFKKRYRSKFGEEPDWLAACYYDAAKVIVEAIIQFDLKASRESIVNDRKKIKNFLHSIDKQENAIDGVTGPIFFDKQGDAVKSVLIGKYQNNFLISPYLQMQKVPTYHYNQFVFNEDETDTDRIIVVDGQDINITNVVYTGIDMIEIKNINIENYTFEAQFFLWFKYINNINPESIEFLNAASTVEIKPIPSNKKIPVSNNLSKSYLISGIFDMEFHPESHAFDQYQLQIKFKHKEKSRMNLLFVPDYVGMHLNNNSSALTQKIVQDKVLGPGDKWKIENCYVYPGIEQDKSFQIPGQNHNMKHIVEYSVYNFIVQIKENRISLRRKLSLTASVNLTKYIIIPALILFCLIYFFLIKSILKNHLLNFILCFMGFSLFISLVNCIEIIRIHQLTDPFSIKKTILMYDGIFIFIYYLYPFCYIWSSFKVIKNKYNIQTPKVIIRFIGFFLLVSSILTILSLVCNQDITKLMAAGGVLAMVIGLAVQMNFSNLISCIAINVEQPYKIDDYIKISDYEGFVQKITWRSTMLNTGDSTVISIPNNMVSESVIVNYDYSDQAKQNQKDFNVIELIVHIKPHFPPKRVQKILMDAVLTSNTHIIQNTDNQAQLLIFNSSTIPDPTVEIKEITDKSVDYVITFHIRSMDDKGICLKAIWYRIWQHCYFAEIEFAFLELKRIENKQQNETFIYDETSKIRSLSTDQYSKGKQVHIAEEEKNKKYFIKEGVVKIQKNYLELLIGAGDSFSDISFFECISDSLIWRYSQDE